MDKDTQLLEENGWTVICKSPFEIEHNESGTMADGIVAKMVLQMLKDDVVDYVVDEPETDRRRRRDDK